MPAYPWFISDQIDLEAIPVKIRAMQTLGVPYAEGFDLIAVENLLKQGQSIADDLKSNGIEVEKDREILAVIAYMQRLGVDITKSHK